MQKFQLKSVKIGVIGLGYVGLPLAVEFSKNKDTIGFDISEKRINELKENFDSTSEISFENLKDSNLALTNKVSRLKNCDIYIITVPTPIDDYNKPNLSIIISNKWLVKYWLWEILQFMNQVYPGCTEEICVPILEKYSKLKFNKDFFCAYSPERVVPGDPKNTLTKIVKVTSGSTKKVATFVNSLYEEIIEAGTHLASSIKVAEASKAIENAKRCKYFVNELAQFDKIGIDTTEVLQAAATKWIFRL